MPAAAPRVAFVNGGILGFASYSNWLRSQLAGRDDIRPEHIVLTEDLTLRERLRRRIVCQRLWPDPPGFRNLDFARYRAELHAGLLARERLKARGGDFDVLHFHHQATAYASLDVMARVPTIATLDCTQSCVLQDMHGRLERWSITPNIRRDGEVFGRAAAIVSASRWAAGEIRRMYPACAAPVHVLPNPVPLGAFDPGWIEERARRASQGHAPKFLFVGGDFPRKGGYDLLEAWRAGRFAGRAELILVTGWNVGPLPAGVVQRRGISWHTPAWIDAWRNADAFVMPTRNEAFGMVYQEASAAGLPVIGTRINAVPEIVEDGSTGLLVPPRDVPALVAAMSRLVDDPAERQRLGEAARVKVRHDADPDLHRERLLDLIYEVAGRTRG